MVMHHLICVLQDWRCNEKQDLQCSDDCLVSIQKQKEV